MYPNSMRLWLWEWVWGSHRIEFKTRKVMYTYVLMPLKLWGSRLIPLSVPAAAFLKSLHDAAASAKLRFEALFPSSAYNILRSSQSPSSVCSPTPRTWYMYTHSHIARVAALCVRPLVWMPGIAEVGWIWMDGWITRHWGCSSRAGGTFRGHGYRRGAAWWKVNLLSRGRPFHITLVFIWYYRD